MALEGGLCLGVLRTAMGCKRGAGVASGMCKTPRAAEGRVGCRSLGGKRGPGGGGAGTRPVSAACSGLHDSRAAPAPPEMP